MLETFVVDVEANMGGQGSNDGEMRNKDRHGQLLLLVLERVLDAKRQGWFQTFIDSNVVFLGKGINGTTKLRITLILTTNSLQHLTHSQWYLFTFLAQGRVNLGQLLTLRETIVAWYYSVHYITVEAADVAYMAGQLKGE